MERTFTDDEVRSLRLRSQRLELRYAVSTVEEVVTDICGFQAQEVQATSLAVRARSHDLTAEDIETARYEGRSVVRTWCIRGTLHLVAVDDLPWLLSLFGPVFVARGQRRLADLGLDDATCDRAMNIIRGALADHGSLTRTELTEHLQHAGIKCDPKTQAPYHLTRRAALLGIICEVSPKDGEEAYDLLENWVSIDDPPSREVALTKLARRYLAAYQPASLTAFASWSRLPMRDIREGWELINDTTTAVTVNGAPAKLLTDDITDESTSNTDVQLLPAYDTYMTGYESSEHAVSAEYEQQIRPDGGVIRPTVIVDGRAVATWKLERSRTVDSVVIDPFDTFESKLTPHFEAEIDDLGRFLETHVEYRFENT